MSRGTLGLMLLQASALAGWLMLVWSMLPLPSPMSDFNMGRLGVAVGPTFSIILALRRLTLPVAQVFEAGRKIGREEAELRPNGRHLRVVDE